MRICPVSHPSFRIPIQTLLIPAKALYALFLRAIGTLFSCVGGRKLISRAVQIENHIFSLSTGLFRFGKRYLAVSENHTGVCRGSCYHLIDLHRAHPDKPLHELAHLFEYGPPSEAAYIHQNGGIPISLVEEKVFSCRIDDWKKIPMPNLKPGTYTFMLGYTEDHPVMAHRFALFKEGKGYLFDPIIGLARWKDAQWLSHLKFVARQIQTPRPGFFTLECYRH